jgi:hypothetical protein
MCMLMFWYMNHVLLCINVQMPHREEDATDPKSRHKGKCESEEYLAKASHTYTAIVY